MKKNCKNITVVCLALFMLLGILGGADTNAYGATTDKSANKNMLCGITLDVSNRYYSVKEIKKYINLASKSKNGYVQFHFIGDQNVGIECEYLDQKADKNYSFLCKKEKSFHHT